MYSQRIVNQRLDLASEILSWRPEYHSVEDVEKFIERIDNITEIDATGNVHLTRNLTVQEARFIENERSLCMCDAAYWLTRYAYVSDETNTRVRFKFRDTQRMYFNVISEIEERGSSIELLVAKARQQFMTTVSILLDTHRVNFYHDVNCVVASADATKSEEMGKKAFFAYDTMPWWLKPKYSRRVESVPGLLEFDTLSSRMSIQHGSGMARSKGAQRTGIARGTTPTVYLLSEASAFPKAEEQIEAAIFRAVHASPKVFGVVESTFAGNTGWFADKYKFAKAYWDLGKSRLCPLFFNWPCARDIYPTKTWWADRGKHMPGDWKPTGKVAEQISKAELFIRNSKLLSSYFGRDWVMPIEQQWFYNVSFIEASESGTLSTLQQEMPCDDVESMRSGFESVFTNEVIEICHEHRERRFDVYGIVGQSIEPELEPHPDEIDYQRPRTKIRHVDRNGTNYQWELIPLKYELFENAVGTEDELDYIDGKLIIFRHPEVGKDYGIGVDSSTGSLRDYSIVNVCRKGDGSIPDVQVAEFRSRRVGHVEVFAFVLPVALYYSDPTREITGKPLIGIEQIASVGDVCQKELKKLGYPVGRFFDFGRYDTKQIKSTGNRQGWFTTGWSRPILIGNFVHVVKQGWYVLNSPWTIESCRNFERHYTASGKEKLEHSSKSHDDDIFGNAISTFILHDTDTLAQRSKRQFRATDEPEMLPPLDIAPYSGFRVNPRSSSALADSSLDDMMNYRAQLDRFRH